jgi:transposase InsO family protein
MSARLRPGLYQYTAIDDCTRYKVLRLYSRRTASNTLDSLNAVLRKCRLRFNAFKPIVVENFSPPDFRKGFWNPIKFRPIKLPSPHLNGKVERSQRTDLDEFYTTVDLKNPGLADQLAEWQHYYNWDRPHSSLQGKTPIERLTELSDKALLWDGGAIPGPSGENIGQGHAPEKVARHGIAAVGHHIRSPFR